MIRDKKPELWSVEDHLQELGTPKGVIGAEDKPEYGQQQNLVHYNVRSFDTYPDVPKVAKESELKFVLPMASFLATSLKLALIDEVEYNVILPQIRQRMVHVILNMYGLKVQDGIAMWDGIVIMCKKIALVSVKFRLKISTGDIKIYCVKLWNKEKQAHILFGDRNQQTIMSREEASMLILNYLRDENIMEL